MVIQWNPSIAATLGEQHVGRYIGVAFINPRRAAAPRVIVVGQSVCLSVCMCILSLLTWMG